jgi:hypothetical protein
MDIDYEQRKILRERMGQNRYAPINGASDEGQQTTALCYIAFYLGEIEQHLATIARAFDRNEPGNVMQSLLASSLHLNTIAKKE